MNKSYLRTPPTLYRYVTWLLSQMPNKEASNEMICKIIWIIYGRMRDDHKLTETGLPDEVGFLRFRVHGIKGNYSILENVLGQIKVYRVGSDGKDLLEGRTPEGLEKLEQTEIDQWKSECLRSTGKDIHEIIEDNL